MMMPLLLLLAQLPAESAPPPFVANSADAAPSRLHVGDTGIRCVRLPCPSRAVFDPAGSEGSVGRGGLLYTDLDGRTPPPPMIGDPDHLSAVRAAWDERRCVAIDGRLIPGAEDRPVLRVDRVVGACGAQ